MAAEPAAARNLLRLAYGAVALGGVASYLGAALYTGTRENSISVEPGHRAVIFDRFQGVKQNIKGEGTKFRIPWVQTPHLYDIRVTPHNIQAQTGCLSKGIVTSMTRRSSECRYCSSCTVSSRTRGTTRDSQAPWHRLRRPCSAFLRKRSPETSCGPI